MDDDRLLRELSHAARRAEARAAEDEERERAIVDPAGEQAAIAAVLAARRGGARAPGSASAAGGASAATAPSTPARAERVARSRWSRVVGIGLVAAAAAAAVVVTMRGPRSTPTLPGYQLEVRGGVASERSDRSAEPIRMAPDTRLSLVARPREDARAPVGARVVVRRADAARVLATRPRIGATGVVTAELATPDVLEAGDTSAEVILLVGAGSALPDDVGALLALARQATPPDDVRVLRVTVTRASPSGP